MTSDKTLRWSAFGFGVFFAIVVALGYIPGLNGGTEHVSMSSMEEHKMLGLYMIGTADDVTHGMTAVLMWIAAAVSGRAARLALTAYGFYYGTDAAIYLVTGILQSHPLVSTFLLNLPHVVIAAVMLTLAYRGRPI